VHDVSSGKSSISFIWWWPGCKLVSDIELIEGFFRGKDDPHPGRACLTIPKMKWCIKHWHLRTCLTWGRAACTSFQSHLSSVLEAIIGRRPCAKASLIICGYGIYSTTKLLHDWQNWKSVMSSSTQDPQLDLGNTYGALFIGATLAAVLVHYFLTMQTKLIITTYFTEQSLWCNQRSNFHLLSGATRHRGNIL